MSRRTATTLTFSVRVPLPPGWTQKKATEALQAAIKNPNSGFFGFTEQIVIRVIKRESNYL